MGHTSARQPHHPLWTRASHGLNLLVLIVMAASGLQIYNANPVFGGRGGATVPELLTLGGWLAGAATGTSASWASMPSTWASGWPC